MENNPFRTRQPRVEDNTALRDPQREAFAELVTFAGCGSAEREVGIVLPVGCGKSGLITLTPFAFRSKRTLVVAPGVRLAQQLKDDFDPTRPDMFYLKCGVLDGRPFPEPVEIRGTTTNRADLDESHVVITNIQQLQGNDNRWLEALPPTSLTSSCSTKLIITSRQVGRLYETGFRMRRWSASARLRCGPTVS